MADTKTFEKQIKIKANNSFQAQAILTGLENAQNVFTPDEIVRVLNKMNKINAAEKLLFMLNV